MSEETKRKRGIGWLIGLALLAALHHAAAQGTAFTYQGRLNRGGSPATGLFDLQFALYDAASGGNLSGTVTNTATPGHAMKVTDHARAAGAILGKAMTALPEGEGLVPVLVTLQ